MEYKVLQFINKLVLESNVNDHLKEGWKCQGGVSMITKDSANYYIQSMIKKS